MNAPVFLGMFEIGAVLITPGACTVLSLEDIVSGLLRHICGDWGELNEQDRSRNHVALSDGARIVSRYVTEAEIPFYIITECDRSLTTVMVPFDH